MFARIEHINDVLPHVEGDSAFRVVEKDTGHTFINYNHMGLDVFPPFPTDDELTPKSHDDYDAYCAGLEMERALARRECRGIAFDTLTGNIASRPFHKFFNAGEREEVAIDVLPFSDYHIVMDKLDGSMIRPLWTPAGFRWGTKMGVTDVAMLAEEFVADKPWYTEYAQHCRLMGRTPIFEFVSRRNRIVVDYEQANMILLAVRDNVTGQYMERSALEAHANTYALPLVKTYAQGDCADAGASFVERIRQSKTIDEGVVVFWPEQQLFSKIKTETYSSLHAAKDKMATERRLLEVVLADDVDDLLPLLPDEDRDRLSAFVEEFWNAVNGLAADIEYCYNNARAEFESKRDFAISGKLSDAPHVRSVIFALWDGKRTDHNDAAVQVIKSGLSSETKWIETKAQWSLDFEWQSTEVDE